MIFDGWFSGLTGIFNRGRAKLTEPDASAYLGGAATASGKLVTPDSSMQLATVWACVRLLAETIGTLPFAIYSQGADGQRAVAPDHALFDLLSGSPNADQTAVEFWEAVVACLCLWGNAYAEKVYNVAGTLIALNFLRPDLMTVYRDAYGVRRYRYADPKGNREYTEDEVFHVRGFGVGVDMGLSPISYARQTIGAAIATDEAAARTFSSGLQVAGFINSGQALLKPEQREDIKKMLQRYTGSAHAGSLLVLEAGMTFSPLGINPVDAQMLETRAFQVEEICRWYRVPPFMVGHSEKSTSWGTGLEQQMKGFVAFSLRPYTSRIEQAVKKQLMAPQDRAKNYAQFDMDDLQRGDSAARAALVGAYSQNGVRTRNELRRQDGLADLPGGDVLTVQSNLTPLEKLGETPPAQTPPGFGLHPFPPAEPPQSDVKPPQPAAKAA